MAVQVAVQHSRPTEGDQNAQTVEAQQRIEVSFKDKKPEAVASEVREQLVKMLKDLGFAEAARSAQTRASTTRGGSKQELEPAIEFRFSIPGISEFSGVLTESGSISISSLREGAKALVLDYGSPTYERDQAGDLRAMGQNIDIILNDIKDGEKAVLTKYCTTADNVSMIYGSSITDAAVVFRPGQRPVKGEQAVEEMGRLAEKYSGLVEPLKKLGIPIKPAAAPESVQAANADLKELVMPKVRFVKETNRIELQGPVSGNFSGGDSTYIFRDMKDQSGKATEIDTDYSGATVHWEPGAEDPQVAVEAIVPSVETSNLPIGELMKKGGFDDKIDTFVTLDGNDKVTVHHHGGTCKLISRGESNEVTVYMPRGAQGQFLIPATKPLSKLSILVDDKEHVVELDGRESAEVFVKVGYDEKPVIEIRDYPEGR